MPGIWSRLFEYNSCGGGGSIAEYRNGHYFADEAGTDKDPYLHITYKTTNDDSSNDENDTSFIGISAYLVMISLIVFVKKYNKK